MPGLNLTREEATERASIISSVTRYEISLDLTRGDTDFGSFTRIEFDAREGASTFADLVSNNVHSITLNGNALDPFSVHQDNRIALENLAEHNVLEVEASCQYMHTGEGLHRFVDPADGQAYTYSQFEVPDARRVYTTFEQPDLKSTFTLTVKAPKGWKVFSNAPTPAPEEEGEAWVYRFATTEVMSTYITAIVAGPYEGTTATLTSSDGRTIDLGVYARASIVEHLDADEIIEITRQGFEFFEGAYGIAYPFTKYDQIFVPEYNAGAMENAGCVTFRDAYVFRTRPTEAQMEARANTILHELAHMWFGDLVTMKWWNDLWLNESFAEFMSHLALAEATKYTEGWTGFMVRKDWGLKQDQLPTTHPITAEIRDLADVEVNFDGITYAKGASVLAALVGYVGRENFFAGIQRYLAAHAYANAELSDLLRELEAVSGRDLSTWTRLWLQEAGVTTLRTQLATDTDGLITQAAVRQEIPADSPASLRPHRVAIGCYSLTGRGAEARLERTDRIELDVDGELTEVPELVGTKRADVLVLNDDDLTYAKVRLDEESLSFGLEHIEAFTESLPRSIVLASAWDMVRDGELAASRFLDAALRALGVEEHSSVIQGLLGRITTCLSGFLPPAVRRDLAPGTADRLLELARAAQPGSDKQLQLVRALAAHAVTDEQLDIVAGLVEASQTLGGLDVDQDLRWDLLIGLVAAGRSGEEQIRAEEARDRTTTGRERAAEARASIPTPEAKQDTWRALIGDAAMPNETQVRVLRGLTNVERRPELLVPFVGAYVEAIDSVWSSRTFHMAENLLTGLWSCATVGLAGADDPATALTGWLESHDQAPAALRRIVRENLDDTLRVARAQAAESQSQQ